MVMTSLMQCGGGGGGGHTFSFSFFLLTSQPLRGTDNGPLHVTDILFPPAPLSLSSMQLAFRGLDDSRGKKLPVKRLGVDCFLCDLPR